MTGHDLKSAFTGSLLGLALGDALGAPFEGGPLERILWKFIGATPDGRARWTDDTQMALDLAESAIARRAIDPDDLALRFARGYRWSRGYGPGTARVLKLIRAGVDWRVANTRVHREGSLGNGAAMRAPVVGLFFARDLAALEAAARSAAIVTHAHPLGQEGAVLTAICTALALRERRPDEMMDALLDRSRTPPFRERLSLAKAWIKLDPASPRDVRAKLGNGVAATDSCVSAIYIALAFLDRPFPEMLDFVAACRGDVDTIGAMAGAIWGARNGESALPVEFPTRIEGAERIRQTALDLFEAGALAKTI